MTALVAGLMVASGLAWSAAVASPVGASVRPPTGLSFVAGSGASGQSDGSATSASFGDIRDIALNRTGSFVYVLELGVGGGSNSIRKVSTRTGVVSTVAAGGYLDGSPTHLEVDSDGDPWVAVTTGTNQKGLVRYDQAGVGTVMVSDICCAYYGASQVGDAFEFDHANGTVYYSAATGTPGGPNGPKFPRIFRLPVSELPADARSGEELGGTGNFIRGPVTDMEFGPDGKLYVLWPATGPGPGYATQVWRLDGPGLFSLVHATWPGHEERLAFSPRLKTLFSTCWFWCAGVNMRAGYGSVTEEFLVGGSSSGYADGDPGLMGVPRGVAITADGSTGYVGDHGNHRIRRFRVPTQTGPHSDDDTRGEHGDPVDTASGAFRQDEVDLPAATGAGPATIARSYSSVGPTGGLFGPRWASDLDVALLIGPDDVALQTTSGHQVTWVDVGGVWTPMDGQRDVLVAVGSGWTLADPGGSERDFDEDGRLVAVRHPGQPEVTVAWGDLSPTTLTSASGYEVTFEDWSYRTEVDPLTSAWELVQVADPDGTIDRATTNDGRQVDYGYDRSTAVATLASVSRPHAVGQPTATFGTRAYTVTSDALLTGIVDQVDATRTRTVVENSYDDSGRVTEQVTATGDVTEFAYDMAPDGMGNLVATPGSTTVTDTASGDVTVYEHSPGGELVGMTDATGNALSRSWDRGRSDVAVSRGGVTTDRTFDAAGRIETLTESTGATTRVLETLTYVVPRLLARRCDRRTGGDLDRRGRRDHDLHLRRDEPGAGDGVGAVRPVHDRPVHAVPGLGPGHHDVHVLLGLTGRVGGVGDRPGWGGHRLHLRGRSLGGHGHGLRRGHPAGHHPPDEEGG